MTALSLEAALARGDAIQVDPIVLTQLEAVVGKRNVATGIADLICYAHDIMPPSFKWVRRDDVPYLPQMVVYPGSTRDVQEIVGIAAYNRIPVIPAGGTSGTIGGILAVCGGIVVDMKRMNKLLEVDEYSLTATAQAGGGMVEATVNGRQELLSLRIDPEVASPDDVEMLQDLILAAVNEALNRSREMMAQEMSKLTGGMQIPGLF